MSGLIIVGSSRTDSQSEKVAKYSQEVLQKINPEDAAQIIFARDLGLMHWESHADFTQTAEYEIVKQKLQEATHFVVITPEWDGMVPPSLKNFFLMAGNTLAHKPALIIAISTGFGGSYPVAELRMSSYKNSKICYIPDHLIIREVGSVLNSPLPENDTDIKTRDRLQHSLQLLSIYAGAFNQIRNSDQLDFKKYAYGM
jgi:hypothetical protein